MYFELGCELGPSEAQAQNTSKNDDLENGPIFVFDFFVESTYLALNKAGMCLGHHRCPHKFPQCSVTSLGLGAGGVGLVTHINYGHYCAPVCQCIEWHGASHVPLCCPSGHLPQLAGRMGGILMNLQTNAGSCYIDFSQRTNNINTQPMFGHHNT